MVPMACAGLALVNTGMGRSRSAAHAMLSSLCVRLRCCDCVCDPRILLSGQHGETGPRTFCLGGKPWNWIAAEPVFLRGLRLRFLPGITDRPAADFQRGLGCADSAELRGRPLATGSDVRLHGVAGRLDLSAVRALGVGRRLAGAAGCELRVGFGLRGWRQAPAPSRLLAVSPRYRSPGFCGPRSGKYSPNGTSAAIPAHNVVLVLLGCLVRLARMAGTELFGRDSSSVASNRRA